VADKDGKKLVNFLRPKHYINFPIIYLSA